VGHTSGLDLEGSDAQGALAEDFDVQGLSAEPGLVVERVEACVETDRPVSAMAEPEPEPANPAQPMPNLRIAASPEG